MSLTSIVESRVANFHRSSVLRFSHYRLRRLVSMTRSPVQLSASGARAVASLMFVIAMALPSSLRAQVLGVQAVFVPARDGRAPSSGIAADAGYVAHAGLLDVWTALAVEYQRQHDLGPGRGRLSVDLRLLAPDSQGWFVPFAGMSVSANRSGGAQSEWEGTRLGLEALAGAVLVPDNRSPVGVSIEERFGYVRGREHALATHIGLRFSVY
jgi:hypothetical protein